jgi:tryptophan synthase beta subunit
MRPLETMPDARGHFGPYGGTFVPETLMTALEELIAENERARVDPNFQWELDTLLHDFAGCPTPLYYPECLTQKLAGAKIYLKREDLLLGVLQGTKTFILANDDGQIELTHSVSGLDYAAIGPEHSYLRDQGRIEYDFATDAEALAAFCRLAELEGIIPALETARAIAYVIKIAPRMSPNELIIVNCFGRGGNDVQQAAVHFGF